MAESFGVEGRGKFYEETGVIRDVIQNHLFQVLSLLAMEAPSSIDAEAIRDEQAKVLRTVRPMDPGDLVLGQFRGYRIGSRRGRRIRRCRRMPRCGCTWTRGAGRACRSSCAPASRSPGRVTEVTVELKPAPPVVFPAKPRSARQLRAFPPRPASRDRGWRVDQDAGREIWKASPSSCPWCVRTPATTWMRTSGCSGDAMQRRRDPVRAAGRRRERRGRSSIR